MSFIDRGTAKVRNLNFRTAALFSIASPVGAWLTMVLTARSFYPDSGSEPHVWAGWALAGVSVLLGASGLTAGCIAVARSDKQRRGIRLLAIIGSCLNVAVIFLWVFVIKSLNEERRLAKTKPHDLKAEAFGGGLSNSLAHNARMQRAYEKIIQGKSNGLSQLAPHAIDFLREEQSVLSNYYAIARPLSQMRLLDMSAVDSPAEIEKRQLLLNQFLEANTKVSNSYRNLTISFQTMAVKGGIPGSDVELQTKQLERRLDKMNLVPIWRVNNEWAGAKLRALGLLESNWGAWSYDDSLRKTIITNKNLRNQFNQIIHEMDAKEKECKQLQQQLQQSMVE